MRIVSWNIRAGGGRRVTQIAQQLARWQPDVAALIEFRATPPSCWLASELARQGLAYQRSTAGADLPAHNRLLVASRWPLRRLTTPSAPLEPGRWLMVRVITPCPVSLAAIHVPNRVSGQKDPFHQGVLELVRRWRGGPALVIGDTNSGRIGIDEEVPCFGAREDRWMTAMETAGWRDAFRVLHADARVYTWYSPNGRNGFRLDQAFVNRKLALRLLDSRYEWGMDDAPAARRDSLSDHAALILDLAP